MGSKLLSKRPEPDAKYRLGNEAETYGEFIFVNNWLNPEQNTDKAWLKTEVMIEANTSNYASYANFSQRDWQRSIPAARSLRAGAGHIFESQPDAKFWAGERYYRRQRTSRLMTSYPQWI